MRRSNHVIPLAPFVVLLLAGLALGLLPRPPQAIHASRLAGISGAGVSGLSLQSLDPSRPMTVTAEFYPQGGGPPVSKTYRDIPPGRAGVIYLPIEPELANGAYAAIFRADRPIAVIGRTDWNASGGTVMYEAAEPSSDILVPGVVKGYQGRTSLLSIQNLDTAAAASVRLTLTAMGETTPITSRDDAIAPGTSMTLDISKDPGFLTVPEGFFGTMRVASASPLAVSHIVDVIVSPKAVYAANGQPAASAARMLYVPRFRAWEIDAAGDLPGIRSTQIAVANPGSEPVAVTLTYHGVAGTCADQTIIHGNGPHTIPAGSMHLFEQGPQGTAPPVGNSGLPANCSGAATIEATGPVVATVVDMRMTADGIETAGAYNAFTSGDGGQIVGLPLFRRTHTSSRLSTDIGVMNVGSRPANVTLRIWTSSGLEVDCGADCQATIPPNASHVWRPEAIAAVPDNVYGAAQVESDQPVVAIVDDVARAGTYDTATMAGQPMAGDGGGSSFVRAIPLLLNGRVTSGVTPTPPSTDTVRIEAIGFVDVAGGSDPACPGCNGEYDPDDERAALAHPLPPLSFVVRDDRGTEVARKTSSARAGLQTASIDVPALTPPRRYMLELTADPAGWTLCGREARTRVLRTEDFQLGLAREDFHLTNGCNPGAPPPTPTATPRPGAPKNRAMSGIVVANVDPSENADPAVEFYRQDGQAMVKATAVAVAPYDAASFFLPALPSLSTDLGPGGGAFAAIADGGRRPIAVLAQSSWPESSAMVYDEESVPATDVVVPLAVKGYRGENTILSVQNIGPEHTRVQIALVGPDGITVADTSRDVLPSRSFTLDVGRDPAFAHVPPSFIGSLRATAATRISALAWIDVESSAMAMYSSNGWPAVGATERLFVPLIRAEVLDPPSGGSGHHSTRLAVANPGLQPVEVTVTYHGGGGSCVGQTVRHGGRAHTIDPGGMALFDLGDRAAVLSTGRSGLPAGCAGTAVLESTGGGILAAAVDTLEAGGVTLAAGAYNAFTAQEAARHVLLPLIRSDHTSMHLTTDVTIMNLGSESTNVTLRIRPGGGQPIEGCGPDGCGVLVAPNLAVTFRPDAVDGLKGKWYGSALVDSQQPIVIVVEDSSRSGQSDTGAYRGISLDVPTSGLTSNRHALPLLLINSSARVPGPPITPYEPGGGPQNPFGDRPPFRVYLPAAYREAPPQ